MNILKTLISEFIGSLVLSSAVILYGKIVLCQNPKAKKIIVIMGIFVMALIYTIANYYITGTIKTLLILLMQALICKKIFKISIQKSLMLSFLYIILLLLPEMSTVFLIINILGNSSEYCYNVFASSAISTLLVSSQFLLLTFILKKPLRKLLKLKLDESKKNIIYLILSLACIMLFFYSFIFDFHFNKNALTSLFTILIILIILSSYFNERLSNIKLSDNYDKLLVFLKTYETEIENQRIYNHEINNQYLTIKSIAIESESIEKVVDYVDAVLNDERRIINDDYAKFKNFPPNGLKGLCYFKVDEARKKGINVAINISSRIEGSILFDLNTRKIEQLSKLIGIYIDNAIEACLLSEKKNIGIEAYTIKDDVMIIISNTYKGELSDKIGVDVYSTKGNKRGHGLMLAKYIIENNKMFETSREITEELYVQKLKITNKKGNKN